jgi:hypothetical protein
MSALAIPAVVSAALPAANLHPHGHGHKKGPQVEDSSAASSSAAAQPAGSTENLLGTLLNSLTQAIGVKPAATGVSATTTPTAPNANAASGAIATAASKISVMA